MRNRRIYLRSKTGNIRVFASEVQVGKVVLENSRGHRVLFCNATLRRSILLGSYYLDPDVGRRGDILLTDNEYIRGPSMSDLR